GRQGVAIRENLDPDPGRPSAGRVVLGVLPDGPKLGSTHPRSDFAMKSSRMLAELEHVAEDGDSPRRPWPRGQAIEGCARRLGIGVVAVNQQARSTLFLHFHPAAR